VTPATFFVQYKDGSGFDSLNPYSMTPYRSVVIEDGTDHCREGREALLQSSNYIKPQIPRTSHKT